MGVFAKLTDKSWLVTDRASSRAIAQAELPSAAPTGLRVYFAVATVMFSLVVGAYIMRMGFGHTMGTMDWRATPEPTLLWVNTLVLIVSSILFQRARDAARHAQMDRVEIYLLAAGLLAFGFLAGQLIVWRQLGAQGYFLATNPANSFFYLITTLHGLHMLGGLIAWVRTVMKLRSGVAVAKITLSVQLCAMYWHFLLIVWLAFFYLLLVT